uniref:Uncharacterized protein n=2 Tax=Paracidobacterium acidisoli TaxID=2303751 RepID=A0A372ILF0_9BACT
MNAVLQVGGAIWDFGESADSEVDLNTASSAMRYFVRFSTANSDNWISSDIRPSKAAAWVATGDWRQSFRAEALPSKVSQFSLDNGTVSATGSLIPTQITVNGLNLQGQILSYKTISGGPNASSWVRQWHLSKPSPRGGCVIESITRTVVGTIPPNQTPITPLHATYWVAWHVAPGAITTSPANDAFLSTYPAGSIGTMSISATARFYEGAAVPRSFTMHASSSSGGELTSTAPSIPVEGQATFPVKVVAAITF